MSVWPDAMCDRERGLRGAEAVMRGIELHYRHHNALAEKVDLATCEGNPIIRYTY